MEKKEVHVITDPSIRSEVAKIATRQPSGYLQFACKNPEYLDDVLVETARTLISMNITDEELNYEDAEPNSIFYLFKSFIKSLILLPKSDVVEVEKKRDYVKVMQPWSITRIKGDFTMCERRILLKVIEVCQQYMDKTWREGRALEGRQVFGNDEIELVNTVFAGNIPAITFPIIDLLKDGSEKNYDWVKKGIKKLTQRSFEIPGDNNWDYRVASLFQRGMSDKGKGKIGVLLSYDLWNEILTFDHYKVFNISVAISFKTVYAERLFELLSSNKIEHIKFSVQHIREMFNLVGKYSRERDFRKRVLDSAAEEMQSNEKCDFYFTYTIVDGIVEFTIVNKEKSKAEQKALEDKTKLLDSITLTDAVLNALPHFLKIDTNRSDIIEKLKLIQYGMGVAGAVDLIKETSEKVMLAKQKGNIQSSPEAYFLGILNKEFEAYKAAEKEKHTYHEPVKPKDDNKYPFKRVNIGKDESLNAFGEDETYNYYTQEFVDHFASIMGLKTEDEIYGYGFERFGDKYWRAEKTKKEKITK